MSVNLEEEHILYIEYMLDSIYLLPYSCYHLNYPRFVEENCLFTRRLSVNNKKVFNFSPLCENFEIFKVFVY